MRWDKQHRVQWHTQAVLYSNQTLQSMQYWKLSYWEVVLESGQGLQAKSIQNFHLVKLRSCLCTAIRPLQTHTVLDNKSYREVTRGWQVCRHTALSAATQTGCRAIAQRTHPANYTVLNTLSTQPMPLLLCSIQDMGHTALPHERCAKGEQDTVPQGSKSPIRACTK